MKKVYVGLGLTALALTMVLLFVTSAFAFSLSLQNLHINAASFAAPVAPALFASPMTSADEAAIGQPQSGSIRFEELPTADHVCQRDKVNAESNGF
jgi:hypothetical protein